MAFVTLEVVDEEERGDGATLVSAKADPGRDVPAPAHRRPAAGAAVAVHVAEIAERPAEMHEPLVLELHVGIGVEATIGRQAARRPELPPVEVPERALEQLRRFLPVQGAPGAPALLVGAQQEAEIVDLESR